MKTIKSRVGVTLVTLSNASLFNTSDKRIIGGSERQMRYVADALISEKIAVTILSSNVPALRDNIDHGVEHSFKDIDALATDCRFRDCAHRSEPGCRRAPSDVQ